MQLPLCTVLALQLDSTIPTGPGANVLVDFLSRGHNLTHMKPLSFASLICLTLLAAGCANHTRPLVDLTPAQPEARHFQAVWAASIDTLRDYGFEIQRKDRRAGIIVTEPMVSAYPTELWRKDVTGPVQQAESAIHKIYRSAVVEIQPGKREGTFQARTRVLAGRSEEPSPQVTHASQIAQVYTGTAPRTYEDLHLDPGADQALVALPEDAQASIRVPLSQQRLRMHNVAELGRDVQLEARINSDIRKAAAGNYARMDAMSSEQTPQDPSKLQQQEGAVEVEPSQDQTADEDA